MYIYLYIYICIYISGCAGTDRPGTTPWRTRPSKTTKRLVAGGTSQPRVASAVSVTRCCVINVGPPTPCERQQSYRSSPIYIYMVTTPSSADTLGVA